ncbi:MAG TPA: UDP-glucose/GDP-mannose dehydrogenase family protein [Candidatus Cybelea sp.]
MTTNAFGRLTVVEPTALRPACEPRRIAIVGTGYVGLVTGTCFAELGNSVVCLDNDPQRIATLRRGEVPFYEPGLLEMILENDRAGRLSFSDDTGAGVRDSNIVFIAVGTPMLGDGTPDLCAIRDVAATIGRELNGPKIVVVKSTVPVGTCELVAAIVAENARTPHRVDVVSNPEFLREGSAIGDFMHPDRVVFGASDPQAQAVMRALYAPLEAPIFATAVRASEMVKYAANAFLATKISFINEIANICDLVNVDVRAVGCGIGLDRRIGTQFMSPGIGYGGSCFPKDVRALERTALGFGYSATLLRSVEAVNRTQVWRTLAAIEGALGDSIAGKTVCVLGLAFKPNTSDIRESPALRLIDLFLGLGARVAAHDPIALDNARARLGSEVRYCSEIYEAVKGADVLVLATEWREYEALDFGIVRTLMRGDIVFDGRHFFDPEAVALEGLWYVGVGNAQTPARAAYLEAFAE